MHACICVYTFICMHKYILACMRVYICKHMHVCMHTYAYTNIDTLTNLYAHMNAHNNYECTKIAVGRDIFFKIREQGLYVHTSKHPPPTLTHSLNHTHSNICIYTHTYTYPYLRTCKPCSRILENISTKGFLHIHYYCMRPCVHASLLVYLCLYVHNTYVCMQICMCLHMYTRMYARMCLCMHINV